MGKKKTGQKTIHSGNNQLEIDQCESNESGFSAVNSGVPANNGRRNCLKLVSAAAFGAGTLGALPAAAGRPLLSPAGASRSIAESDQVDVRAVLANLSININMNRSDLPDWILIENLREQPLVLKQFAPRWLVYNQKLLDLNSMLSRQQRGRSQLEIWPSYAWNHSMRGAVRSLHECGELPQPCFDATQISNAVIQSVKSLQLQAHADAAGVVTLLESQA